MFEWSIHNLNVFVFIPGEWKEDVRLKDVNEFTR